MLVHLVLLFARVGEILLHPGQYLFVPGGDGLKTYFSIVYYVLYDHGLQFTGMHYPYGEQFIYTDGFPLLAWALKAWQAVFGISPAGIVASLNLAVLLSSLPATPLVYALLRRSGVGRWFGALVTLTIVFLSPQFHRIGGHLTLALPFVVPLLWYLQVRLTEAGTTRARARWMGWYTLTTVLLALIHPYYLLHALLLPFATAVVMALQQLRREKTWWQLPAWLVAAGLTPLVIFRVITLLLDPITDRPVNPYGLLAYHANAASVFGPVVEPFSKVFQYVFHTEDPIYEGWAYVGLPVVIALVIAVLRMVGYLWRRRPGLIGRPVLPRTLRATVWAVVPILLFSMAWPFIFAPFAHLLDLMPAIKQFRALGRFAWLFYYVIAVWAALQYWQLYRLLRMHRLAKFGLTMLGAVLLVWGVEAKYQIEAITSPAIKNEIASGFLGENEGYSNALASVGYYSSRYQAILPLPYFSLGSEKFGIEPTFTSSVESFRAALHLHLPLAATMMSRTSIEQTLRLLELFSSDLTPKSLPATFPDQRPLLIVASSVDSLRPAEKALLRRGARLLTTYEKVKLYELPLSAFATVRPQQEAEWFAAHEGQLVKDGPLWRTQPGAGIVWQTFGGEQARGEISFTRPGAAHSQKDLLSVFEGTLPNAVATDTATYELSIWAYAKTTDWLPAFTYQQFGPDGQPVEQVNESLNHSTEISGNWARYSTIIHLRNPANKIAVQIYGDDMIVDDLLIRPRSTNVYWFDTQGKLVFNGFPLHLPPH
ncbi:hypothetical protein GCM10028824_39150 [Hymenobacter segetis]